MIRKHKCEIVQYIQGLQIIYSGYAQGSNNFACFNKQATEYT